MKAQDLKNSVLQLAIQGKLVEQNPNDEPASILLEKIREEKEQLIKEKKIKREKPLPMISEEEKPFEIPDTWEWIRLSEIAWLGDGRKIENTNLPYLEVKYLRGSKEAELKDKGKFIEKGQLVILVDGENSGEVFVIGENGYLGSTFKVLNYSMDIYWEYLMWLLRCYQDKFKNNKTGSAIPHLNKTLFKNLPVGLPPLEEQKRIVAKIEEVLEKIEEYDKAEKELRELEKYFPQDIRKSILQYAFQGKLVEQNPNDEAAYILLAKIKAEKEHLIKEKKIPKKKQLPNINGEKKPFEIPNGWEWTYLSDISIIQEGAGIRSFQYREEGIQLFTVTNILENDIDLMKSQKYVSREEYTKKYIHLTLNKGDIVTACSGGSWGKTAIYDRDDIVMLNTSTLRMRFFGDLGENKYLYYITKSPLFKEQLRNQLSGMQPNFGYLHYSKILIPLPPLEEQKRIVTKIEKLMCYVDKLEDSMNNKDYISKIVQAKSIEIEEKDLIKN